VRLVWNEHAGVDLLDWFVDHLPIREEWPKEECRACGIVSGENILAVVVFHHWSPTYRRIQVSIASADARWALARNCIKEIYAYAFDVVRAIKVYAETPAANMRAVRALRAVGMQPRALLEHHFGPGLTAVYSSRTVWEHRGEQEPPAIRPEQWGSLVKWAQQNVKSTQSAEAA